MRFSAPFAFVAASLAATAVSAHFTLDYPTARGFDEDIEGQFCGGFPTVGTRQPFPLTNGSISIDSHHESAQVAIVISFDEAPTTFAQFNATDNGTVIPYLLPFGSISPSGEFCFKVDVESLGLGVQNGTNATIQVIFNGGDGALYQCTDVTLFDTVDQSNVTCVNGTSTDDHDDDAAASTTASESSATSAVGAAAPTASTTGGASRTGVAATLMLGAAALVALVV